VEIHGLRQYINKLLDRIIRQSKDLTILSEEESKFLNSMKGKHKKIVISRKTSCDIINDILCIIEIASQIEITKRNSEMLDQFINDVNNHLMTASCITNHDYTASFTHEDSVTTLTLSIKELVVSKAADLNISSTMKDDGFRNVYCRIIIVIVVFKIKTASFPLEMILSVDILYIIYVVF
jgi:hypothetical protein